MNSLYTVTSLNKFRNNRFIYWLLLVFVIGGVISLPFIKTTISTKATGFTRPINERTDIRSVITGIVDQVFYKEGDTVTEGATIAILKNENSPVEIISNNYETTQRSKFIHDLKLLTESPEAIAAEKLQSPYYRQQYNRYMYQLADQQASLKKVQQELAMNRRLLEDKVIARKEMFDKEVEGEKLQAAYEAFRKDQLSIWQQELDRYQAELSQLAATRSKIHIDNKNYEIKASVTGIVQGINRLYAGNVIQAGEAIASISPESHLIAECYVNTRDIGLLRIGQPVKFQIDAFDYNYFGILTGRISGIDNDFTMVDKQPVFVVRCSFDTQQLHLKNGFTGQLKKGLSLQARFVVAERTLWQLLFDKIDDWLNPSASTDFKNTAVKN